MDVVNNLELIIPKMREQLYLKKIYSLDVLYQAKEEKYNIADESIEKKEKKEGEEDEDDVTGWCRFLD